MKFTVIGAGRWGSFIAWYLDYMGYEVTLWGREESEAFKNLCQTRKNEYVTLPSSIKLTTDLKSATDGCDVAIISVKSQALRQVAKGCFDAGLSGKPVVLCMKGIEIESGKRLTEVMTDCGYDKNLLAVWVGPGHIQEFVCKKPNCMVIDGYDRALVEKLVDLLKSPLIRFYYGDDIIGSEIGAAAKNVIGIAAGFLDGCSLPSLKGPLMARGAREVARLIHAMGGKELSAYGLCHLGDYETTLFSPHSNNLAFGISLSKGEKFPKLAEGVYTAAAMIKLGKKYGVDLPITQAVYNVIYEGHNPEKELSLMFDRKTVTEFLL